MDQSFDSIFVFLSGNEIVWVSLPFFPFISKQRLFILFQRANPPWAMKIACNSDGYSFGFSELFTAEVWVESISNPSILGSSERFSEFVFLSFLQAEMDSKMASRKMNFFMMIGFWFLKSKKASRLWEAFFERFGKFRSLDAGRRMT